MAEATTPTTDTPASVIGGESPASPPPAERSAASALYPDGGAPAAKPSDAPAGSGSDDPAPAGGETKVEEKVEAKSEEKVEAKPEEKKVEDGKVDPSSYKFELPEGFVEDKETMTKARDAFAELNLTNDQAQKLMNLYAESSKPVVDQVLQAQQDTFKTTVANWEKEINQMPEFSGAEREKNVSACAQFIEEFGGQEVKDALNATGLGSHPAFVKMVLKAAETLMEGGPINPVRPTSMGKNGQPLSRNPIERLYPEKTN